MRRLLVLVFGLAAACDSTPEAQPTVKEVQTACARAPLVAGGYTGASPRELRMRLTI